MSRVVVSLLDGYKRFVSPWLPRSCRFSPTCSEYARLAILERGPLAGGGKALVRLLRCQPLTPGGIDLP